MISFACPTLNCVARQQLSDEFAGSTVICPACLLLVRVPGAVAAPKSTAVKPPAARSLPIRQAVKREVAPASVPPPSRSETPRAIRAPIANPVPAKEESRTWFYERDGSPTGPVVEEELPRLIDDRRIAAHTLVWSTEFRGGWQPAGAVLPGLFRDVTDDDLLPPTPVWQQYAAYCLMFIAMGSVVAAGLVFRMTIKSKASATSKSAAALPSATGGDPSTKRAAEQP